jgi:hypothetical protein
MDETDRSEIVGLERALLAPETRHNAEWLDGILAADMTEIGRSGRRYDKDGVIAALVAVTPTPAARFELIMPKLAELASGIALLTYRLEPLEEGGTPSLRSSIWRKADERWQLVFHQGTTAA